MSQQNKKAVRFLLTPRPQKDPLTADFEAPQNVLVPKGGVDVEQVKKQLPDFDPVVFQSKDETRVGMLERAHRADGITLDTDILNAMSKDFNYEDPNNMIDDDFVTQAGGFIEDEGEMLDGEVSDLTKELFEDEPEIITFGKDDASDISDADSDDYDLDQEGNGLEAFQGKRLILFKQKANRRATEHEATKSRETRESRSSYNDDCDNQSDTRTVFTNYSMTSSVMRRNQGLQQIDEHFERLYEKEYADDTEIGALDLNEVRGDELLTNIDQIQQMKREVKEVRKKNHGDDYEPEMVSEHYKNAIIGDEPNAEAEDLVEVEITKRENRVDCESILSYNSNLYNHPKLIVERSRRRPSRNDSTQMDLEQDDSDNRSRSGKGQSIASSRATILSKLSIRPANETIEEKRARKKALKAYRQERRQERKQNQDIFKQEQAKFVRQQRNNMPTLKLS